MASDSPGDHELYGVVDPDPEKLKAGNTGVGTRVTMRDQKDDMLLNLIVMLNSPAIARSAYIAPAFAVVGAVLGVLQAALGVQAVLVGLRLAGFT